MSSPTRDEFVAQVIETVHKRFPLLTITAADEDFAVRIKPKKDRGQGHLASLENLYRMTALDPKDVTHHIERWAVELLRASEGHPDEDGPFEGLKERIMPMILPAQFCDEAYDTVVSQPLIEGLRVAYAIDSDRTISYIAKKLFDAWEISLDDLHEQAIDNLVTRSEEMHANVAQDDAGNITLIILSARRLRRRAHPPPNPARPPERTPRQPLRRRHPPPRHPPLLPLRQGNGGPTRPPDRRGLHQDAPPGDRTTPPGHPRRRRAV